MAALPVAGLSVAAAQDPAAERLLREAERLEKAGEVPKAIAELELLVGRFAGDELAPAALLRIAEMRRDRGESAEAAAAADQLVTDYALSSEAAAALNLKTTLAVRDAASTEDLLEAQNSYRRVALLFGREAYPVLEARRDAQIASGEIALALGDFATAAAELVAAIEDEAASPAAGRGRLGLARAWLAAGQRNDRQWTAAAAVLEELAAADDATSEDAARRDARRLLSLVHRRLLRPIAGQKTWLTSGRYPPAGATLREPSGVAAADDGRLLIVDERLSIVVLVGADGSETGRQSLPDVGRPGWIDGLPFVVAGGNVVLPFDGTSYAFNDPRRNAPMKNLNTAAGGTFGDWFVAAKGWKSLLHFRNGRQGRELMAGRRPDVVDVARGPRGHVYVLDARAAQVLRLDRDAGGETVHLTGDWRKAVALAVDELGHLYVLDRGNRRVDLYSPEGQRLAQVGPALGGGIELRNPVDIAVDGGGRLFIADTKLPFVVMLD